MATTVRKWGVQFRHDAWMRHDDIPSDQIECARLFDSPQNAAAMAGTIGTVREVLVTQEAGELVLCERLAVVSRKLQRCVVVIRLSNGDVRYLGSPHGFGQIVSELGRAHIFDDAADAFSAALRLCWELEYSVWRVENQEPREVRRAGRTLYEILASVPVEVPSDD